MFAGKVHNRVPDAAPVLEPNKGSTQAFGDGFVPVQNAVFVPREPNPGVNKQHFQISLKPICRSRTAPNQAARAGICRNTHQNPLFDVRPVSLGFHGVRNLAQSNFSQYRQVLQLEEVLERLVHLVSSVNFAIL